MPLALASEIMRDYTVDGEPLSGVWNPRKSDLRDWMAAAETAAGVIDGNMSGSYLLISPPGAETGVLAGISGDQIANFSHGAFASPVTAAKPSVNISRYETISVDTQGGQNATLFVNTVGNNVSSGVNSTSTSVQGYATQIGKGDVQGIMGIAVQQGTGGHTAYGGYFQAHALSSGAHGYSVEVDIKNDSGTDHDFTNLSPYPYSAGMHIQSFGTNRAAAAIWVGDSGAAYPFDAGLAFTTGSVRSYGIADHSSSINSIYIAGSHTYGINLGDGTYSAAAIIGPGFYIQGGAPLFISTSAPPSGGNSTLGIKISSTANFGMFFGSGAPTLSAAKGSIYLRSDGSGTSDRAYINTNGSTTWTALTTAA